MITFARGHSYDHAQDNNPRPCPTFHHKKRCGTTEHRYHCLFCPLSFTQKGSMQRQVRQQHSNNAVRFPCTMCGSALASKQNLRLHMEKVHADQKPCFGCWYCNARLTRKKDKQTHVRRVHGRICREQYMNLQLHLKHLSEEDDFQNECMFVESKPIEPDEHNVCPCGQTPIQSYFFIENKFNGNNTFAVSECIRNIDPKAYAVIDYFKHILENDLQGIYKGQDNHGLQTFTVRSNVKFVQPPTVKHLNPALTKNQKDQWEVLVIYPKTESLVVGQTYFLRLKAKYQRGHLTFTTA